MALTDEEIAEQNPWWREKRWQSRDPHLVTLEEHPMRLPAELVGEIDLDSSGVNVLRGPRQVGKSTNLKLLIDRALQAGWSGRSIVYLALDLLEDQPLAEMARTVRRAKELAGSTDRTLLLLDEVTSVRKWQGAVKSLWDSGAIRGDLVICTGSSAIDLHEGAAERLPGRRNGGTDYLILPQSFASFAAAVDRTIPAPPGLRIGELRTPAGRQMLEEMQLHKPALDKALARYLAFGGLPAAVAEAMAGATEPSRDTRRVMWDSLLKELQRKGASVPATLALLGRVTRALGAETNWSALARDMDVPLGKRAGSGKSSHHTLKTYIEWMASGYFVFTVYFWKRDQKTSDLSKNKKLFLADPLLHTVALERAPGLTADIPALVENAVGLALYRRYEPEERLVESFVAPDRLHIWRTAAGGEIDFVAGPLEALDIVEVKYQSNPGKGAAANAAKAHPGRPVVVATKDHLYLGDDYSLIPSSLLLWALG